MLREWSADLRVSAGILPRDNEARTESVLERLLATAPPDVVYRFIYNLSPEEFCNLRLVSRDCRMWLDYFYPLYFPAIYHLPVELIQQILCMLPPSIFEAARKTCNAWYRSSLDPKLLRQQLGDMGFCGTDPEVKGCFDAAYLSGRLTREWNLGTDGRGRCEVRQVATVDMTEMVNASHVVFTWSMCGKYVMLSDGCVIHVFRLEPEPELVKFIASIVCPRRVLAVSMDTSSRRFSVAILLVSGYQCWGVVKELTRQDGRMGLVHDLVENMTMSVYRNLCSDDDPPRSVAICPQRRCVAFGCHGGIELHCASLSRAVTSRLLTLL